MTDKVEAALRAQLKEAARMHTKADMAHPKRQGEITLAKIKFRNAERMLRERREAQSTDSNNE